MPHINIGTLILRFTERSSNTIVFYPKCANFLSVLIIEFLQNLYGAIQL